MNDPNPPEPIRPLSICPCSLSDTTTLFNKGAEPDSDSSIHSSSTQSSSYQHVPRSTIRRRPIAPCLEALSPLYICLAGTGFDNRPYPSGRQLHRPIHLVQSVILNICSAIAISSTGIHARSAHQHTFRLRRCACACICKSGRVGRYHRRWSKWQGERKGWYRGGIGSSPASTRGCEASEKDTSQESGHFYGTSLPSLTVSWW